MTNPSLTSDREFIPWLQQQQISLAFTTYQTNWLALIGVNPETGNFSAFQRQFNRAMGLYCTPERLYVSSKYQIWQVDNVLAPGQLYQGYDKLFIPRIGYTTGDIDVHDVVVDDQGKPVFISTLLNCLATVSDRHSCQPLWKPPFISQIINEDRCHLNGLAMVEGKPRYVNACSRSDIVDGWRDKRRDGGIIIDIESDEIILSGLSMPHSPRFYQGKLWLLNSGTGEFGYVDIAAGKFEPVTFCPGYARGLAFWRNYAIIGLSQPRSGDGTFSGLPLDDLLSQKDTAPRCGLLIIDLNTGVTLHWLRIEGTITELYDVGVIPGCNRPMSLGFQTQEIEQIITLEPLAPIQVQTKIPSPTNYYPKNSQLRESLQLNLMRCAPQIFTTNNEITQLLSQDQTQNHRPPKKNPKTSRTNQQTSIISSAKAIRQTYQNSKINSQLDRALQLHQKQQFEAAIAIYQQVLEQQPDNLLALTNIGKAFQAITRHQEAIIPLRRAIQINPTSPQLHFYLSQSLKAGGDIKAAANCLRETIRLQPDFWGAYNNLGTILQAQNQLPEAAECYQNALKYNPNFAEAQSNLASIWQLQGELEQAKAGFVRALEIKPNYIPALLNLAYIYKQQGPITAAIACYQQVIALKPNPEAYFNLGEIWEYQGDIEAALECYEKLPQLARENYGIDGYIIYARLKLCDWEDYDIRVKKLVDSVHKYLHNETAYSLSPLALSAVPVSLELHREMAEHQAANISQKMAATKARCNFYYPTTAPDKLRIGYISPDFREHAVGKIVKDMFQYHNRAEFEVYAYSTVDYNDAITETIRQGCDQFINIAAMSPETAARRIQGDGIHIIIDLAGRTIGNALEALALQPAPIQAQFLGYPDTIGADFIQYVIADPWLITPEIAQSYTEDIIYLPHAFFTSPMEISSREMTRAEFGLPDDGFVFCCFNSHYKINPEVFDVWMRILRQVPQGVLWLTGGSEKLMANLRQAAQQRGIDGNRIIFTNKIANSEYLARYRLADLFLDTFIYNAGSTAISALWAGVPVLTRPGNTYASRMGASICAAADLKSLICPTNADYEKTAIYLANHSKSLAYRCRQLSKNRRKLPLFDVPGFVQNLETALRQMWENYQSSFSSR
ncbi:MAG: hypothetical protein Fur0025_39790 [Oscillatoriaceae cyanobacterium]